MSYFSKYLLVFIAIIGCSNVDDDHLQGIYRIRASGGYGVILNIKDSVNIDYLTWTDVGGFWKGFHGNYKIKSDSLFITIFYPYKDNTHGVRLDTLLIHKHEKKIVFIPNFINSWSLIFDDLSGDIISGQNCYAKISVDEKNYYKNLNVIEWDTLITENSIPSIFPPAPPKNKLDSIINDSLYDESRDTLFIRF